MSLLQITGASKGFGSRVLFENAAFTVGEGEHIGLIGPNGAGKTTLIKIIAEQEEFDTGEIVRSRSLRLGYLEQEADWNTDETVEECLVRQCPMPLWDLKKNGKNLGLYEEDFSRLLSSLSGGYRMRVKLLSLIGRDANLLLLDEPTNFLDLETVLVVEKFLQSYEGAFLLISHDREFLLRVTDHTVEVEAGDVTKYPGNIDDYFEQKALIREQLEKSASSQAAKRKQVLDFVSKFGAKATKAKQAQSRLKSLDRMEKIDLKPLPTTAKIPIPAPIRTGKEVLRAEGISSGYGDRTILSGVNMVLNRGDHLGIVGLNGAGKSTLLKTIAEAIPLKAGQLRWGMNVTRALFSQHSADQLHPDETIGQALQRAAHPEVLRQEVLNMAGALLFGGPLMDKKIRVLSGGEKARVSLGQILLSKCSLLLLDEPTNHLDFDTVEALTNALSSYEGSLVVVSHDRGFIRRVASRIMEVNHGHVTDYPGTYDDYVWSVQKGALSENVTPAAAAPKKPVTPIVATEAPGPSDSDRRARLKNLDAEIRRLEKSMPLLEKKLTEKTKLRDELNLKLQAADKNSLGALLSEFQEASARIEQFEEQILADMELLEKLLTERQALRG